MAHSTSSCSSTSASTSYAHNNYYVYDVFINHRGPDCKKTFATDLYNRLRGYGLRVFLDQQELQEGDDLTAQIKGAILKASVHIAIFSRNYAESYWCLEELLLMLQSGATILPVFYDGVKPSDLRWVQGEHEGVYARALKKLEMKTTFDTQTHQDRPRYQPDTIKKWRKALSDAANISGFELENYNGEQHPIFQRIVKGVLKNVKRPVHVAKYPIGLDKKVKDFQMQMSLPQQSSETKETRVIGIVGLGGVGKTTLANEIFNRLSSKYDRPCHLSDVSGKPLEFWQSKLLMDLARCSEPIADINDGIQKIKRYLPAPIDDGLQKIEAPINDGIKKIEAPLALIILDNVDHIKQLDALLVPVKDGIRKGSLILITSRKKDVLKSSGIVEKSIYNLEGLDLKHSRELFCSHAFGQPNPVARFEQLEQLEQLVENFLDACKGLPLSLAVVGALLYGQDDLRHWKAQLNKISATLPDDIKGRLKISFDDLDEEEKQIFLEMACFFIGEDRDTAVRICDGSGWNGWLGLWKLQNRCLMEVDSENHIRMHDHLRDLGRDIGEKATPHRLWRPIDSLLHDLSDRLSHVRGIGMVHQHGSEWPDPQSFKSLAAHPGSHLLTNMRRLQVLKANGNCVESIFSIVDLPQPMWLSPQLVWLCWHSCPFTSLPSWIPLNKLRVLEIKGIKLETLWPDEHQAPLLLRELIVDAPLSKIPESIGHLKNLEKLVLYQNERVEEVNLKTFLDELCHLKSLQCLVLRKCPNMKSLPDSFVNLTNLEYIDLSGCINLQKLPKYFWKLQNLQHIDLSGCVNSKTLPPGLWKRKKPPGTE